MISMKTEFTEVSETRKHLSFEVPPTSSTPRSTASPRAIRATARVPGFRPGQGAGDRRPAALQGPDPVRRRARPDSAPGRRRAAASAGSQPVATPDIKDVVLEEGQPLTFVADFETMPPIDPGDYTGLSLRKPPAVLEVGAVDRALEQLQQRAARWHPVEDRPAADGRHAARRPDAHAARPARSSSPAKPAAAGATPRRQAGDAAERLDRARQRGQPARVRRAPDRRADRRHARVHGHLPGRLRGRRAGGRDGRLRRHGEGHPPQGTAAARRRVREGSERRSRRSTRCATRIHEDLQHERRARLRAQDAARPAAASWRGRMQGGAGRAGRPGNRSAARGVRAPADGTGHRSDEGRASTGRSSASASAAPAAETVKSTLVVDEIARREQIEATDEDLDAGDRAVRRARRPHARRPCARGSRRRTRSIGSAPASAARRR